MKRIILQACFCASLKYFAEIEGFAEANDFLQAILHTNVGKLIIPIQCRALEMFTSASSKLSTFYIQTATKSCCRPNVISNYVLLELNVDNLD